MKYKTIVIDPPWNAKLDGSCLKNEKYYRCGRLLPYSVMSDEEIYEFPIHDFADINCDLFMWVVHSKLPIAFEIIAKWGFKYHCLLTWDKTNGVSLHGFQRKTEHIIYCYKGKMGIDRSRGKYIPTLFKERLTTHSTKPNKFYDIIRDRTKEPRIDIFSRRKIMGFESWGDENLHYNQNFIDEYVETKMN